MTCTDLGKKILPIVLPFMVEAENFSDHPRVNVILIHTFVSCFIETSLVLESSRARTACLSQVEEVLETHSA
jgi:hypothetical protein